jgi:MFS family permease
MMPWSRTDTQIRWCFYINLPIGALVLVFLYLFVDNTPPALGDLPFKEKIRRIDIPGTLVFVPSVVCLLLALQWGGQKYDWSDARIIALLVVFAVLLIAFVAIQLWRQEAGTVPPRILKQRTILGASWYAFMLGSSFFIAVYYMSIWFQAIKGDSAIKSGYSTLPLILGLVFASIGAGVATQKLGYYNPAILAGGVLVPIGNGLLTMFKTDTAHPFWIGAQFLFGFGVGCGLQQTNIAAQTVLDKKDAPTGVSVVFFFQGLGGAVMVALAQNVLDQKLIAGVKHLLGPGKANTIVNTGATQLRQAFTKEQLPEVLTVYNHALVIVFYIGLAFGIAAIFGGALMEWAPLKKKAQAEKAKKDEEKAEESLEVSKGPQAVEETKETS